MIFKNKFKKQMRNFLLTIKVPLQIFLFNGIFILLKYRKLINVVGLINFVS